MVTLNDPDSSAGKQQLHTLVSSDNRECGVDGVICGLGLAQATGGAWYTPAVLTGVH